MNQEFVDDYLTTEFEKLVRAMPKPPRPITFERDQDGEYIDRMVHFIYGFYAKGALAGAELTIQDLLLKELQKTFTEFKGGVSPRTEPPT